MKRSEIKRRPLSDTVIANLEPELKEYRELDGNGLYIRVKSDGSKSWQLRTKKTRVSLSGCLILLDHYNLCTFYILRQVLFYTDSISSFLPTSLFS